MINLQHLFNYLVNLFKYPLKYESENNILYLG